MAKEIKSISVEPSAEESTINLWQSFGWDLKSTQEVKTSDASHLERRGDTIYNVTQSGEHYIKLTFERDPARQNYAELKSLEGQYYSISDPSYYPVEPKRFGCISLGIIGFLLLGGFGAISGNSGDTAVIAFLIIVAIVVWRSLSYSKKKKLYDEEWVEYSNKSDAARKNRQEILEKAKSLV